MYYVQAIIQDFDNGGGGKRWPGGTRETPLLTPTGRGKGVQIKFFIKGGGRDPPMGGFGWEGSNHRLGGVNPPLGGICINSWMGW